MAEKLHELEIRFRATSDKDFAIKTEPLDSSNPEQLARDIMRDGAQLLKMIANRVLHDAGIDHKKWQEENSLK